MSRCFGCGICKPPNTTFYARVISLFLRLGLVGTGQCLALSAGPTARLCVYDTTKDGPSNSTTSRPTSGTKTNSSGIGAAWHRCAHLYIIHFYCKHGAEQDPPSRTIFAAEKVLCFVGWNRFGLVRRDGWKDEEKASSVIWLQEKIRKSLLRSPNLSFLFAMITLGQIEPPARKTHGCLGRKKRCRNQNRSCPDYSGLTVTYGQKSIPPQWLRTMFSYAMITLGQVEPPARKSRGCVGCKKRC